MNFSVSILATGSELLDGRVVDTNSNLVARALSDLGLKLKRILIVDDDLEELVSGLKELGRVSDIIITSGGLGPTSDDLTREMVAQFFGVGLTEFPEARKHLEQFYLERARKLDPANLKQALLPVGATMIPNKNGTAPGFIMSGCGQLSAPVTVCSLSGVPREFAPMFNDSVLPVIRQHSGDTSPIHRHTFKIFGLPESVVGKLVEGCGLSKEITVSYRAAFPEVHVTLKASQQTALDGPAALVRTALNNGTGAIYTEDATQSFIKHIQQLLLSRNATVACAESCTGGLVASYLTETPGSSSVFLGGVVAYENRIKQEILKVPRETLDQFGAVSAETVRVMAAQVRELMHTTYGIAVSGIAGPAGGSADKPVGTVWIAISGPNDRSFERKILHINDRRSVRIYASYVALDLLRRELEGLAVSDTYPISVAQPGQT
jgi:nicotinamide-nucleotide amidase